MLDFSKLQTNLKNEIMRKKILFALILGIITMDSAIAQTTIIAQGTCGAQGDNLTWVLTSDSVLTISGSGEMENYLPTPVPWSSYRTDIRSVVIEDGVTTIGNFAFHGCSSLASVIIGNSVTTIGNWAFEGSDLTSIIIPNSVTTIGNSAFANTNLTSVTVSSSVTTIGAFAFSNCSLMSINVDDNNLYFTSENGVLFDKQKATIMQYPAGKSDTTYIIPNTVTTIGHGAFSRSSLTSIIIPNSVTTIGNSAFWSCSNLTAIIIPNSVVTIGNSTFQDCTNLTSVIIGNSVTVIGERAFIGTALTSVVIPNSVTTIGNFAFQGCSNLTSVIIGNGVTSIGRSAFSGCIALTSVVIGSGVTNIGLSAFWNCSNLTSVTCYALVPPNLSSLAFSRITRTHLYVPEQSLELYKQTPIWQDFIIRPIQETSITETQTAQKFIFPNPVTDSFQISGIEENTLVTISDINGRIVMQQMVSPNENVLVNHLSQGTYFVNAGGKTMKIIR